MVLAVLLPPGGELRVHELPGDHLASDLADDAQSTRDVHQATGVRDLQLGRDLPELERRDHGCEGLALQTDQLVTVCLDGLGQSSLVGVDLGLNRCDQRVVIRRRDGLDRLEVGVLAVKLHLQRERLFCQRVDEVEDLGIDVGHVNHLLVINERPIIIQCMCYFSNY